MSSRYMMHTYTQTHVGHIWSTHGTRVVFIFTSTHLKRTHSVNHGAHSHFYIFGTGRVHTETHTRHAYANLYGHTWIHIKQLHTCRACANRTHTCRAQRYTVRDAPALKTHTPISQIHTPKDLLGQTTLSPWDIFEHTYGTQSHTPHTPVGQTDEEYILPLGLACCSSLPSGHDRALAPSDGPLSVCSGFPFIFEIRPQEISELRNKMDTEGGMCYSRLRKANKT